MDEKGILDALKQTYATKTKELEDKEVRARVIALSDCESLADYKLPAKLLVG